MAKSRNSRRWLQSHISDAYVRQSRLDQYRSRAVYKLIELDDKEKLLRPSMTVVELGSAPGGWTQYIVERIGDQGRVIAADILPMDSFAGVEFIQGDFTEESVLLEIEARLGDRRADLVLSDMAPNLTGVAVTDQARSIYLAELALDLAQRFLSPKGVFVTKLFHGQGFDSYINNMRGVFGQTVIRKPSASRDRSREVYAVARNLIL